MTATQDAQPGRVEYGLWVNWRDGRRPFIAEVGRTVEDIEHRAAEWRRAYPQATVTIVTRQITHTPWRTTHGGIH